MKPLSCLMMICLFAISVSTVLDSASNSESELPGQVDIVDTSLDRPEIYPGTIGERLRHLKAPAVSVPAPGECNGHPLLCDRPYDEIVFAATHNAANNAEEGRILPNQNRGLQSQLADGVRAFLLDIHERNDEIMLCHKFCALGSQPLLEVMTQFHSFLKANTSDVVTVIFEDHVGSKQIRDVIEAAELVEFLYVHDPSEGWPTLGEMIERDTRLVVAAESTGPPPRWLHNLWDIGWDTPYLFTSADDFGCEANRGSTDHDLLLVNHWITNPLPSEQAAARSNRFDTLIERIDECEDRWDRLPTFIAVDFYDVGDILDVVDALNGLPHR